MAVLYYQFQNCLYYLHVIIAVSNNKMDDNDFDNLYNSRLLPVMDKLRENAEKRITRALSFPVK